MAFEKIIEIRNVENTRLPGEDCGSYDGFEIQTDKQVISLLIHNWQNCCETWGYFMCNDDLNDFVGKQIIKISLTDDLLNEHCVSGNIDADGIKNLRYEGMVMFVNIHTSAGVLQFVAYNSHNGYYTHNAVVVSDKFKHEVTL